MSLLVATYQLWLLWFADNWREFDIQSAVFYESVIVDLVSHD